MGNLNEYELELVEEEDGAVLFAVSAQPVLLKRVIEAQLDDEETRLILNEILIDSGLPG